MASWAIAAHPAQAYRWLGNFTAAKTHSETALAVHQSALPCVRDFHERYRHVLGT